MMDFEQFRQAFFPNSGKNHPPQTVYAIDQNHVLSEEVAAEEGELRITGTENDAEKKVIIVKRLRHIEKTLK